MKLWRSSEEKWAAAEAKAAFDQLLPQLDTQDPAVARETMAALRLQADSEALSDRERGAGRRLIPPVRLDQY